MRNRIKDHRKVKASDLVPHELNWRTHPEEQQRALKAILDDVGFARSLLAYELPDGKLKLIDGHLRKDIDPDAEVDVEVLDVNDEEARKLLLSIDPLCAMAGRDDAALAQLREITQTDEEELAKLWKNVAQAKLPKPAQELRKTHSILVECQTEAEQVKYLRKFHQEGIPCRALVS